MVVILLVVPSSSSLVTSTTSTFTTATSSGAHSKLSPTNSCFIHLNSPRFSSSSYYHYDRKNDCYLEPVAHEFVQKPQSSARFQQQSRPPEQQLFRETVQKHAQQPSFQRPIYKPLQNYRQTPLQKYLKNTQQSCQQPKTITTNLPPDANYNKRNTKDYTNHITRINISSDYPQNTIVNGEPEAITKEGEFILKFQI